jgi:hypothetical protein
MDEREELRLIRELLQRNERLLEQILARLPPPTYLRPAGTTVTRSNQTR